MTWNTWKPALALGAVLAASGAASADDRDTHQLGGGPSVAGATMTLGGKGTAAQAATEDNELTHGYRYGGYYGWGGGYGYRGYYGGYRGGYGGYYGGYRGGYYGGYRGGYSVGYYGGYGGYRGGYYGGYRPYYGGYSFGYGPSYYSGYSSFPVYTACYGPSIYLGIGGASGTGAPVVTLGESFARPQSVAQPMAQPVAPGNGTFPYDGGPANPVPLPKADPETIPPAGTAATDLPISLKPKSATPYKYKAYGEK